MALSAHKSSSASGERNICGRGGSNTGTAIYNLGGMRIGQWQKGINIVRTTDGKVVKVMK